MSNCTIIKYYKFDKLIVRNCGTNAICIIYVVVAIVTCCVDVTPISIVVVVEIVRRSEPKPDTNEKTSARVLNSTTLD